MRLPYLIEPVLLLGVLLFLLWWAIARRGFKRLAFLVGRGGAHLLDTTASVALRLEHRSTASSRRRGDVPGGIASWGGNVMEGMARAATSVYQTCQKQPAPPLRGRAFPVVLVMAPVATAAALWIATSSLPVDSSFRFRIAQAEARWTDLRGALGAPVPIDPTPTVVRSQRHPGSVSVRLACRSDQRCAGWLALERRSHRLHERFVTVTPRRQKIISLTLRGNERWIAAHGQLKFKRP